jgi:hypothetical protein
MTAAFPPLTSELRQIPPRRANRSENFESAGAFGPLLFIISPTHDRSRPHPGLPSAGSAIERKTGIAQFAAAWEKQHAHGRSCTTSPPPQILRKPIPFRPRTELGRRLHALRLEIVRSGARLLTWEEIEREVAERRENARS